ncbi:MAG TPA: carboxypeptidase-like regulatory domain-containing protein [Flavobacteriia bacterium]|nr:carboxypeptidase-like regulatory domain-containing protein [Flavobacteriia bacterium]
MYLTLRVFRLSFIIALIFQSSLAFGQQKEFINGRLINSKTKEPIPFATMRIKNKANGLISNFDGGFKIPIEFQKNENILEISSIGYQSREIILSSLSIGQINIIYLTEKVESLDEVVVTTSYKHKRPSAYKIVRLAIKKIPQNFPFTPFSYVGYYRDYQLKEGNYLNLNEALMEVFDSGFGFQDFKDTKIRIYQLKENSDFQRDTIATKPYDYVNRRKVIPYATMKAQGGNEYTILRLHNSIRNYNINTYDFIGRFDMDFIKRHKLRLAADTFIDGIPLFVIKISKAQGNFRVFGKIYISKKSFAIYKMEYAVYQKKGSVKKQETGIDIPSVEKKHLGKLLYEIVVEYQAYGEKMYPNYISFNNLFEILEPPKFIPIKAIINKETKNFELVFNNLPLVADAVKRGNYKLYYQGIKLKINKIEVKRHSVLLYPENKNVVFNEKLIQSIRSITDKGVAIEVKNVRDIYGNVVNKPKSILYNQFREFFVQQLKLKPIKPSDTLYMIKTKSIFQDQPIAAPKNLSNYWMNTPLKNR